MNDVKFEDYISLVGAMEAQEIHPAGHWSQQVLDRADGKRVLGDLLPWQKTQEYFELRPGEVTLWAGMSGHRKSMLLGQVMTHVAKSRQVAIASLEMYPQETLFRMICQSAGVTKPTRDYINNWMGWADSKIVIYDQLDKVEGVKILGFVHYAAKVLGCKHIVIDSLTKLGITADENRSGEKDIINRLQWAAKTLGCHIHLVCHVRKPQGRGEEYIPNKFDIRGAGEITDVTDNIVILWKDKKKEKLLQMPESTLTPKDRDYLERPDQRMIVEKQRHGAWEGTFYLWFHESMQFMEAENRKTSMEFSQ